MYGKRRLARYAVFAVVAATAIAGCGGGGSKPNLSTAAVSTSQSSTSSASIAPTSSAPAVPAIPADVPRTGHNVRPGEKPPEYPVAALAKTQAGANAFAEFYLKTLDWAYATTNPSYMKHYSGSTCGQCDGLATGIAKTSELGDKYEGGRLTIRSVVAAVIAPVTAPSDFCSLLTVDVSATSVVDSTGKILNGAGAFAGDRFKLCVHGPSVASRRVSYLARL